MSSVLYAKALPIFVMILLIVWFWEGQFSKKISMLKSNKTLAFMPLLFVLFALGMLYSENQSYGLQKMETRLSLFVIPVILPSMISLNFAYNRRVFSTWYVGAAVLTALICILRSVVLHLQLNDWLHVDFAEQQDKTFYFFHNALSKGFMNPEYLAMYVNTALIFCLYDLRLNQSTRTKMRSAFQAIVLLSFVVLLNTTVGFISVWAILLAFTVRWAWLRHKWQILALTTFTVFGVFVSIYFGVALVQQRVDTLLDLQHEENHNPFSIEANQTRIHAWKAAKELIAEKPAFGHGTGDVMDVLYHKYDELNFTGARSQETNAHNEYFQTGIALGFLGISLLIAALISTFHLALRRRNFALGVWSICLALAMTFESYLNTQAGVVLLALFTSFITLFNCDDRSV